MRRLTMMFLLSAMVSSVWSLLDAPRALAQEKNWVETKCSRYKQAWTDAVARMGTKGIGQEFLERHEAFLASGCTTQGDVCPRSEEELKLANMLVVAAMNAGTASTFPPFGCRRPPSE